MPEAMTMDRWRAESSPFKQTAMGLLCAAVGVVLAYGFRDHGPMGLTNAFAGYLLGWLLLLVGGLSLIFGTRQTIVIDDNRRLITIEDRGWLGEKSRRIRFDDIADIRIGYQGKRSSGFEYWYLLLELTDGKTYPLFAPGRFYEGTDDRSVVEGWRQRLERMKARPAT